MLNMWRFDSRWIEFWPSFRYRTWTIYTALWTCHSIQGARDSDLFRTARKLHHKSNTPFCPREDFPCKAGMLAVVLAFSIHQSVDPSKTLANSSTSPSHPPFRKSPIALKFVLSFPFHFPFRSFPLAFCIFNFCKPGGWRMPVGWCGRGVSSNGASAPPMRTVTSAQTAVKTANPVHHKTEISGFSGSIHHSKEVTEAINLSILFKFHPLGHGPGGSENPGNWNMEYLFGWLQKAPQTTQNRLLRRRKNGLQSKIKKKLHLLPLCLRWLWSRLVAFRTSVLNSAKAHPWQPSGCLSNIDGVVRFQLLRAEVKSVFSTISPGLRGLIFLK